MPRQSEPDMHDPADSELHTRKGDHPYPKPNKSKVVGEHVPDEKDDAPSAEDMRRELKKEGATKAWKKGETQDAPPEKN